MPQTVTRSARTFIFAWAWRSCTFRRSTSAARTFRCSNTHFLREFAGQYQREVPEVPREHIERLVSRAWRGNVRELRNAAERHVLGIGRRGNTRR